VLFVRAGDNERQPADREPVQVVVAYRRAPQAQCAQRGLAHVALGGEAVHEEAVGHLAGHLRHSGSDTSQDDRRIAIRAEPGVEERRHQCVRVKLTDEIQQLPGGPAVDLAHREHIFPHPVGRRGPRHREPLGDTWLDLRAHPEQESATRIQLKVVGHQRH